MAKHYRPTAGTFFRLALATAAAYAILPAAVERYRAIWPVEDKPVAPAGADATRVMAAVYGDPDSDARIDRLGFALNAPFAVREAGTDARELRPNAPAVDAEPAAARATEAATEPVTPIDPALQPTTPTPKHEPAEAPAAPERRDTEVAAPGATATPLETRDAAVPPPQAASPPVAPAAGQGQQKPAPETAAARETPAAPPPKPPTPDIAAPPPPPLPTAKPSPRERRRARIADGEDSKPAWRPTHLPNWPE